MVSFDERLKQEIEKQDKIDYNDFIRLVRKIKIIVFSIIFSSFGIVIIGYRMSISISISISKWYY